MHKYEIIDVIDEGAYGIVWKAINKQTNQLVAIKEFKEGDEDQFSRKTIQREIKMLKMLKSQFVVGIKEAFKKKGKIYLIFEYFEHNLLNLIEKYEHGLQPKLINSIIYKIIKCLQFLHQKNIIHRDIKPENLLLNNTHTTLKICDFGFARFLPEQNYDLTEYVATRWYRSPELLVGQPYGKAADIWAIGCMIGQLVDGQPMFPGDDEIDQIYIIKKGIADLTPLQLVHFKKNEKFRDIDLPDVKRTESIEGRYLGKIEKNALSFMRCCLKMDPNERITVEEALKHPYLLPFSLEDNEFSNDQQNLLSSQRKLPLFKNESKASLVSVKDEEQQKPQGKYKFSNNSSLKGLKLDGNSLPQKQVKLLPIEESDEQQLLMKKKSHTNLQHKAEQHILSNLKQPSPKLKFKNSITKLNKMMSQEKNLKLNVDLNLKINLKINQKLNGMTDKEKTLKAERADKGEDRRVNYNSNAKLPEIKGNRLAKPSKNIHEKYEFGY